MRVAKHNLVCAAQVLISQLHPALVLLKSEEIGLEKSPAEDDHIPQVALDGNGEEGQATTSQIASPYRGFFKKAVSS